jgi:uncharacterized damage-inducible protein DinB
MPVPESERKTSIRNDLVEAQQQLREALERVGADEWDSVSANEGWTVRQLVTHLTTAETGFVSTLRRMASGQGGVPVDFDPNRWNAGQLRRRGDVPVEQLRSELEGSHRAMLDLLEGCDDAALDQRGQLSTGVEGSTEDNFRLVASHKRDHTADIRSAFVTRAQSSAHPSTGSR